MRVSDAFPSNYVKCSDLQDQQVTVVIASVAMEDIGDDNKPVVYFQGRQKGMVLNKTNANNISALYGDDTDDWTGREIILYPAMVDFQGRSVPAIRVKGPAKRGPAKPVARPKPVEESEDPAAGISF